MSSTLLVGVGAGRAVDVGAGVRAEAVGRGVPTTAGLRGSFAGSVGAAEVAGAEVAGAGAEVADAGAVPSGDRAESAGMAGLGAWAAAVVYAEASWPAAADVAGA